MVDLKRFQALKAKVEKLQRDRDRAEGVLEQIERQLREEFECNNVLAGEAKLKRLKREQRAAQTKYDAAITRFEKRYGDLLQ